MDDPLSEVLRAVRLTGGVFLSAHFSAPFSITVDVTSDDCAPFLRRPAQMIAYHVVTEGALHALVEGETELEVSAGEIVLFPHNDVHILRSATGIAPVMARELIQPLKSRGIFEIAHGGGGKATHIVCGFLASEETYNPLIAILPRVLKIDVRDAASREWILASVRFAANELAEGRQASSSIVSRLSETLLAETVRQYSSELAEEQLGWLKGLKDAHIGRALALIHGKLAAPWSVDGLAREAALSRSAFVDRFTSLIGMPPMKYLTVQRLQAAKLELQETDKTIAQLAHLACYESPEAFSRAFKREFGLSPVAWRERNSL
jgi:AraC-like DNA-binding protein